MQPDSLSRQIFPARAFTYSHCDDITVLWGTYFYKDAFRDQSPSAAVCSRFGVKLNSLVQALDYSVKRGRAAPVEKGPWECYFGQTVSWFVCRTSLAMRAAGMFAALSWSWAQGGWVFCWLPLSDSWVMGLLLFAFHLCVCVCLCVWRVCTGEGA